MSDYLSIQTGFLQLRVESGNLNRYYQNHQISSTPCDFEGIQVGEAVTFNSQQFTIALPTPKLSQKAFLYVLEGNKLSQLQFQTNTQLGYSMLATNGKGLFSIDQNQQLVQINSKGHIFKVIKQKVICVQSLPDKTLFVGAEDGNFFYKNEKFQRLNDLKPEVFKQFGVIQLENSFYVLQYVADLEDKTEQTLQKLTNYPAKASEQPFGRSYLNAQSNSQLSAYYLDSLSSQSKELYLETQFLKKWLTYDLSSIAKPLLFLLLRDVKSIPKSDNAFLLSEYLQKTYKKLKDFAPKTAISPLIDTLPPDDVRASVTSLGLLQIFGSLTDQYICYGQYIIGKLCQKLEYRQIAYSVACEGRHFALFKEKSAARLFTFDINSLKFVKTGLRSYTYEEDGCFGPTLAAEGGLLYLSDVESQNLTSYEPGSLNLREKNATVAYQIHQFGPSCHFIGQTQNFQISSGEISVIENARCGAFIQEGVVRRQSMHLIAPGFPILQPPNIAARNDWTYCASGINKQPLWKEQLEAQYFKIMEGLGGDAAKEAAFMKRWNYPFKQLLRCPPLLKQWKKELGLLSTICSELLLKLLEDTDIVSYEMGGELDQRQEVAEIVSDITCLQQFSNKNDLISKKINQVKSEKDDLEQVVKYHTNYISDVKTELSQQNDALKELLLHLTK